MTVQEFIERCRFYNRDVLDFTLLPERLRLEVQYGLQRRHDHYPRRTTYWQAKSLLIGLRDATFESVLDAEVDEPQADQVLKGIGQFRGLLVDIRHEVERLLCGSGMKYEFDRDVWRLRHLGITSDFAYFRFDRISQPKMRLATKKWAKMRLALGQEAASIASGLNAVTRLSRFLEQEGTTDLPSITRQHLLDFLSVLILEQPHNKTRGATLSGINGLLRACRQNDWAPGLSPTAEYFSSDYPRAEPLKGRALSEHVMAQLEAPENLARLPFPYENLTALLMGTGLRIGDACPLPLDCLATDAEGGTYLRYFNHKSKREAHIPIDDGLRERIQDQVRVVRQMHGAGSPVLFPRTKGNPSGKEPVGASSYRYVMRRWLQDCRVVGETGESVLVTPHQFRHTYATRMINNNVPADVVRRLLDHTSSDITTHYARLHDKTVRREWERATKVNIQGVPLAEAAPELLEAAWLKTSLGRATQMLPNGYCGKPIQNPCSHANACLTCPMFLTTKEFLPEHEKQRQSTMKLIATAESDGRFRMVEMNRQVLINLDSIIARLRSDQE